MESYKNTLNLPKTKFPMKGNLKTKEPEILKKWKQENIYHHIQNFQKNKEIFLLHDGPPYANGNIHIGHAVNKIIKDMIIKSKTLSGFNTPYIPIWDCHGLPIEHQIEKKIKHSNCEITKQDFRKKCYQYANQQIAKQKADFIRLGVFGDWENYQSTMNKLLESNVIRILGQIIKKKYLYQGLKPVHWCIKCQSALAEAEVEYIKTKDHSIIVMFKIIDINHFKKIFTLHTVHNQAYIIVWTTTPWTLPANRAVALHPEIEYNLIQLDQYSILVAKNLTSEIMKKINIPKWTIIQTKKGKTLENIQLQHPFLHFNVPIILSTHVTNKTGTGAVHIAPDYGEEDYLVSQKYHIKLTKMINDKGIYQDNIHPTINKKNIFKSNKNIIHILEKKKLLLDNDLFEHEYPHCWRHKYPIIYRTTKQWFIKINNTKIKKDAIQSIQKVKWTPKWGYQRMYDMLKERPDWCISRQRIWGIPITIFIHKKTKKMHPKTIEIIEKIAKIFEKQGSEIWWNIDKKKLLGQDHQEYKKSTDVLDVWFESGCIHNIKLYKNKFLKKNSNMYAEGIDQYRGWFMSSLIISTIINQKAPYQEILTHSFVIDNSGKKMSKSLGNTITPNEIIKIYGADILRLWVASTNYTTDIIVSSETFKQISEQYRRIRNTSRFLLSNIYDFDNRINKINFENMILLDKWIIEQTNILHEKIILLYKKYKFYKIIKKIITFCSIQLGSYYLDIVKDRQYTNKKNSIARRSGQTAMYYIIKLLLQWITPILPFTAYEIFNYVPNTNKQSIFSTTWKEIKYFYSTDEIIKSQDWEKLFLIKSEVNKIIEYQKKEKKIHNSLEMKIIFYAKNTIYKILMILKKELKFIFLVSEIKIKKYEKSPMNTDKSKNIKELKILIQKYIGVKCPRCWNYFNQVKTYNTDKNICDRCNENIHSKGENRQFV
ncbi:isoleucine--tRNA ligase [Buchnera aphidicola]|uniref:isoleucine--tRNA ligase n=1 Tax=Buchnera aphidicola TaxID=9 RepID=UPI0031B8167A